MSARVEGPDWAKRAVNPRVLSLIGSVTWFVVDSPCTRSWSTQWAR